MINVGLKKLNLPILFTKFFGSIKELLWSATSWIILLYLIKALLPILIRLLVLLLLSFILVAFFKVATSLLLNCGEYFIVSKVVLRLNVYSLAWLWMLHLGLVSRRKHLETMNGTFYY